MYVWMEVMATMKEELRYTTMVVGELCAIICGIGKTAMLFVECLDTMEFCVAIHLLILEEETETLSWTTLNAREMKPSLASANIVD